MRAGSAIRAEWPGESGAISSVVTAAFAGAAHSGGYEAAIVDALRLTGDLALSLVATDSVRIVGHAAFSPVTITDGTSHWYGLGPVSVLPELQGLGIGGRLIREGLAQLVARSAAGVVVFGNPAYYGRFGFKAEPGVIYPGAPPGFFQTLLLSGALPTGVVSYSPAFG